MTKNLVLATISPFFISRFCFSVLPIWANEQTVPLKGEIRVLADKVSHRVSPFTTGACIEDVNHEIYGGIYSQMIFGESFVETPNTKGPQEI